MTTPPGITRRTVIKGLSASSLVPLLGGNLIGCSDGSDETRFPPVESVPAEFLHGVASGDPLGDRVILWTRVTPERAGDVWVDWEIATDEAFGDIVNRGGGLTRAGVDYTVKVDAGDLEPGSSYYYRFLTGDKVSAVGRTRTAATGTLATASLAVVSCASLPHGYFNVYREVAKQEVDAVVHLGDYLYEYDRGSYDSARAEELGRLVEPPGELLSLADYRTRYAQYHTDPDLVACHSAHPFIIVWDDHEVANNSWREGAENHDPDSEGSFSERRTAAIQAWFEWLPVRPPGAAQDVIYRRFQFGDLVDLLMLDTRQVGRDRQVDYADYASGGIIDAAAVNAAVADSNRSLLGATQREWLEARLTESTARWQVLGQQVVMARQPVPEPIARGFRTDIGGAGAVAEATAAVLTTLAARGKPPEERTAEEQALLDSSIPLNPDVWDGYAFEREQILHHAHQLQSRLVVLAGDSHNAWGSQLTTADGTPVGVEFAGPSVTSPGAEGIIGASVAAQFAGIAPRIVDDLKYANLVNRGYMAVTFTSDQVSCEWRYVSTIDSREYQLVEQAGKHMVAGRDDLLLA